VLPRARVGLGSNRRRSASGLSFDRVHNGFAPFSAIRVGVPCLLRSLHLDLAGSSKSKLDPSTDEPLVIDFLPGEIVAARGAALVYAGRPGTVDLAGRVYVERPSAGVPGVSRRD
jgi:hypothetical protein